MRKYLFMLRFRNAPKQLVKSPRVNLHLWQSYKEVQKCFYC